MTKRKSKITDVSSRKKELQVIGAELTEKPSVQAKKDAKRVKRFNHSFAGKKSMRLDNKTIIYASTKKRLESMAVQILNKD